MVSLTENDCDQLGSDLNYANVLTLPQKLDTFAKMSENFTKELKDLEKKFRGKSIKPTEVRRLTKDFYSLIMLSKDDPNLANYKAIIDLFKNHANPVMKIFVNGTTFGILHELSRIYNCLDGPNNKRQYENSY